MFVPQWLQQLQHCLSPGRSTKGRNARRRSQTPRRVRLCLEGLEERLTPSVVNPVGNDSPALVGQVNPAAAAATTTTASDATANFSSSDQTVTLNATVTSSGGTVNTGTVTFTILQGTRVIGTATPSGTVTNGQASADYTLPAGTSAGTYTIDAAYHDGTGSFDDSSDATHTLTVSSSTAAATATTASPATATFSTSAQNVTLSATVTSNTTPVTAGSVQFTVLQGNTVIGTATTSTVSNGTFSVNNFSLPGGTPVGSYTIEADYFDNSGQFDTSSGNNTLTVSAATPVLTPSSATANFSLSAQSVTLNSGVTIKGSNGTPVNEGTVTFTLLDSKGNTIGTPPAPSSVSNGQASVSYQLPAGTVAGSYTIKAAYHDPAGNFVDVTDTAQRLNVLTATSTTTASNAATAFSSSDQKVTLTANVTSPVGTVNEGTVAFALFDNRGNAIGTETTGSVRNGVATVSYLVPGGTPGGSYVIDANYNDAGGSFDISSDSLHTLTINAASTTTLKLTTVTIVPNLSNSTAQLTLTVQVTNPSGTVNQGSVSITLAGVSGSGNVSKGTASVQLTVPLATVSNLVTAAMTYTDKSASANFGDVSSSAIVTTNLWNALLPADLTFDSSGDVQNQLNVAGNTSLLGFSYLASGLLTDVLFDSVSLPVTYSNVGGNTVTTFLGSPTAITFANANGQVLGFAKVFFNGTQLQWLLFDPNNNPIGEVPYTSLI